MIARLALLAAALGLVAGCASSPTSELPRFGAFQSKPRSGPVQVFVMFGPPEQVRRICAAFNDYKVAPPACIVSHVDPTRPPTIWISELRDWDDPYVAALGHEILHFLRAEHR
jgi:hypothetical protein